MANKGKAGSKAETSAWQMADGLRNNMDLTEYKHVVFGLIFLKYSVYDPCCGSGGMLVQSARFVAVHPKNFAERVRRRRPHGDCLVAARVGDELYFDWICP